MWVGGEQLAAAVVVVILAALVVPAEAGPVVADQDQELQEVIGVAAEAEAAI